MKKNKMHKNFDGPPQEIFIRNISQIAERAMRGWRFELENEGFGEGNFCALFESIELDQIRRGVLVGA